MKKFFIIWTVIGCMSLLHGVELVKEGIGRACVVIAPDAPAPVKFAASELIRYVQKITGVSLAAAEEQGLNKILLGTVENPDGKESYRIESTRDTVRIYGNSPRAVLYGTYALIEKFFGVRWFAPGELYEHCPSGPNLAVPDKMTLFEQPEFSVRTVGFVGCNWNSDLRESWKFLTRNRWQVKANPRLKKFLPEFEKLGAVCYGGGHTLSKLVSDELFDEHPEYFALVKGKRIKQIAPDGRQQAQPCTTSPAVIALAIKGITEFFDRSPRGSIYLIGNNDVQVWCECASCTALDPPGEKAEGYVSSRFFTFINEVVKGVRTKHPHAEIRAWGYQNYRFSPESVKVDPSLRINLCDHQRCYRHSMGDFGCTQNHIFRKMFNSWRSCGLPVTERGYQEVLLKDGYFYLPIEHVLAGDLRYFKKTGVDGYEYTISPPDGTYGRRYSRQKAEYRKNAMFCLWQSFYVCGKMLWDTSLDAKELLADAGKCFYGKAWSAMKEFRELLTELYHETSGHVTYGHSPVDIGRCLQKPGAKKKLLALLEKAEKLAAQDPDPKVAGRLAAEKRYFMETWIKNAEKIEKSSRTGGFAVKRSGKVIIDGALREKSWTKAPYIAGFAGNVAPPAVPGEIFAKVLYDKDFLYISAIGADPAAGEKWLLSFPDHQNFALRVFDLDAPTPFVKSRKIYDGKVSYEIALPRKLAGLSEPAAGFMMNIKRVQHRQVCGELYKSRFGCVPLGREVIDNGSFADVKSSSGRKNITSEKFPAKWGFSGKYGEYKEGRVALSGALFQYMKINGGRAGGLLRIEILCAPGKDEVPGRVRAYLSLQKSPRKGKFRHEVKKYGKFRQVSGKNIYRFSFSLAPGENGYLYVGGRDVVIENICAAFETHRPQPEK